MDRTGSAGILWMQGFLQYRIEGVPMGRIISRRRTGGRRNRPGGWPGARAVVTARVPMTVLGGFLGTGKTTLLNRILSGAHGVRYAVLVNDFGELDVDGSLVAAHGGDTLTFANGCVCCSMGDDLVGAIDRLLDGDRRPDQILLEASGVADPASIADVATLHPGLSRDPVVVIADLSGCARLWPRSRRGCSAPRASSSRPTERAATGSSSGRAVERWSWSPGVCRRATALHHRLRPSSSSASTNLPDEDELAGAVWRASIRAESRPMSCRG